MSVVSTCVCLSLLRRAQTVYGDRSTRLTRTSCSSALALLLLIPPVLTLALPLIRRCLLLLSLPVMSRRPVLPPVPLQRRRHYRTQVQPVQRSPKCKCNHCPGMYQHEAITSHTLLLKATRGPLLSPHGQCRSDSMLRSRLRRNRVTAGMGTSRIK